jgi:hypothetical protein
MVMAALVAGCSAKSAAPSTASSVSAQPASAPVSDAEVQQRVDRVRAIGAAPVPQDTEKVNQELDQIGAFLQAHGATAGPVIRRELEKELRAVSPNQFFLLDMGFAAARMGDLDTATKALLRIDVKNEMVVHSSDELFFFVHAIAHHGRPEVIPVIDRVVLDANLPVFVPQHALRLDPTLQGAFLYGVFGPSSEQHLASLLDTRPDKTVQLLELLNWVGTRQSVPAVVRAVGLHPDLETLKRAIGFFMRVGGAAGRDAALKLDRARLEPTAGEYLAKVQEPITKTTLASFTAGLGSTGAALSDAEVRQRLDKMVAHDGVDEETNPGAVLQSTVPTQELIDRLARVRSATFHRISDEALSDVEVTNALLNAVEYRNP